MEFLEHWHSWLILAFIILIVELMSGTYFLLAVAGGAFLTSAVTWFFTPSITLQLLCFAVASAATYMFLLSFRKEKNIPNNDGTTHMLGQHVQVMETINQQGRVRYKGVVWQAISEDIIEADNQAEILSVDGSTLTVKNVQKKTQEEK
ncbi:MAG: NfeD family protein [Ghiorsea sp.]